MICITYVKSARYFLPFSFKYSRPQNFASLNNVLTSIAVPYAKMPEIFKKSRVLILPSYYEGYELVTIEALCCGCPVIGYNVGAIRELYAESFHGVFIANNKEDLAQVAYKLISLDNEKYYHLRQTIYSKRELFLKRDMRKF